MSVEFRREIQVEDRHEGAEGLAPDEPLEEGPPRVVIWTVEARAGDDLEEPMEEVLVTDVHANRDGGLPTIATEAPFTDEDPEEKADLEVIRHGLRQTSGPPRGVVTPYGIT